MAFHRRITAQVRIHAATELSRWLNAAVRGAVDLVGRPEPAARIAAGHRQVHEACRATDHSTAICYSHTGLLTCLIGGMVVLRHRLGNRGRWDGDSEEDAQPLIAQLRCRPTTTKRVILASGSSADRALPAERQDSWTSDLRILI